MKPKSSKPEKSIVSRSNPRNSSRPNDSPFNDMVMNTMYGIAPHVTMMGHASGMSNNDIRRAQVISNGNADIVIDNRFNAGIMSSFVGNNKAVTQQVMDNVTVLSTVAAGMQVPMGMIAPSPGMPMFVPMGMSATSSGMPMFAPMEMNPGMHSSMTLLATLGFLRK